MMTTDREDQDQRTLARRSQARRTALLLGLTALGLYVMFILKGVLGS
jgi:hypothetical protein